MNLWAFLSVVVVVAGACLVAFAYLGREERP
jgi:hypothetical protein